MPYSVERIPLHVPAGNREASVLKDARLVNCWVEKDSAGRVWVQKRPALVRHSNVVEGGAAGHGIFYWDGFIYAVFGTTLYRLGTPNVAVGTVNQNGVTYSFTATLGATHKLFFHNMEHAYVYDGATISGITDPNFPLNISPGILGFGAAYLDGVVYVVRQTGAAIFGSDSSGTNLNDPTTWPADNVIVAQIEPDDARFIAKHLTYLIVGKQWTTEVFHDAGNPTGSPLAPDQGIKMNFGNTVPWSVQDMGGDLIWIATTREGSVSVVHLTNLRATIVSTPAIERRLEAMFSAGTYLPCNVWGGKVAGHRLYAITTTSTTFVYDLTVGLWYEWLGADGKPFPIVSSTYDGGFQRILLQNATDGDVYSLDLSTYQDDNGVFDVDIYTPNWDGETRTRKHMNRLELVGDQVPGDACYIAVSDDDYQTWSDYRTIDRGVERQLLFNCGTFRRRAFHIHHSSNNPFRVLALEASVAPGSL